MRVSEFNRIDDSIFLDKKVGQTNPIISSPHYHNACEIHYFMDGEINFFIRDQSYRVKKGDILFIDAYEIHHSVYKQYKYEKMLIIYKPAFLKLLPKIDVPDVYSILNKQHSGRRVISLPELMQKQIESLLMDMMQAYIGQSPYKLLYLNSYMSIFLSMVADYLQSVNLSSSPNSLLDDRIKNVINYIGDNIDKHLTLDEISSTFNLNKHYLCRLFKEHTGLTIMDFVNKKRILTAEQLILQNKYKITDISLMVGFNSLTHFERMFKQITGLPPSKSRTPSYQEITKQD